MTTARIKTHMSLFFLKAAYRFLKRAEKYENENEHPNEDYNADVLGGIISSATFLECYVNDVYTSIAEQDYSHSSKIPIEKRTLIEKLWDKKIPRTARYPILEKYCIFIDLIDAKPFDLKANPFTDASILIDIRNELVHFEPKWIHFREDKRDTPVQQHKFEEKLKSRFGASKMHPVSYFQFPHYCLSAACVEWSFNTAKIFVEDFNKRSNLSSVLDNLNWDNVK